MKKNFTLPIFLFLIFCSFSALAQDTIKENEFNQGLDASLLGLIQGKIAGVNIQKNADYSTNRSGYSIEIRGRTSLLNSQRLLFMIDGLPMSDINHLHEDDIDNIVVLKDASEAALYGIYGGNGVIIINTKQGNNRNSKFSIDYSGSVSLSTRNKKTGFATPEEFRNLETLSNGAFIPDIYLSNSPTWKAYNTDWVAEMSRNLVVSHNHNFAISGSMKNFNYRASVSYKNAEGIAKKDNKEDIYANFTANNSLFKGWFDLKYHLSYIHTNKSNFTGDFDVATTFNPTYPIFDENSPSEYYHHTNTLYLNPVEVLDKVSNIITENNLHAYIVPQINIKAVKGLSISSIFSFEQEKAKNFYDNYWGYQHVYTEALQLFHNNHSFFIQPKIQYENSFGNHAISAFVAYEYRNHSYRDSAYSVDNYLPLPMSYLKFKSFKIMFAKLQYSYADKYSILASLRTEDLNKTFFPAAKIAWNIKNENFLKNVKNINELRLSFGFGITGQSIETPFRYFSSIDFLSDIRTFSNIVYSPDLTYSKKYEYNIDLDFAFFENRISGSVEAYYQDNRNIFATERWVAATYWLLARNVGGIKSKGIELTFNFIPVKTKDFVWISSPIFDFHKDDFTNLLQAYKPFFLMGEYNSFYMSAQIAQENSPIGSFYKITSTNDIEIIGNPNPVCSFYWNNSLKYKDLELSFLFRGTIGNDALNAYRLNANNPYYGNVNIFMKDIDALHTGFSSYFIEDGSYLKLANIALQYDIPLKNRKYLSSCKLYFAAQNVFTITKYSGSDPEIANSLSSSRGIQMNYYPTFRNYMLGIKISFL